MMIKFRKELLASLIRKKNDETNFFQIWCKRIFENDSGGIKIELFGMYSQ